MSFNDFLLRLITLVFQVGPVCLHNNGKRAQGYIDKGRIKTSKNMSDSFSILKNLKERRSFTYWLKSIDCDEMMKVALFKKKKRVEVLAYVFYFIHNFLSSIYICVINRLGVPSHIWSLDKHWAPTMSTIGPAWAGYSESALSEGMNAECAISDS